MSVYNEVTPTVLGSNRVTKKKKVKSNTNNVAKTWPLDLQNFAKQSMIRGEGLNEQQRSQLQAQLIELIETAASSGSMNTNDWSSQKVPVLDGGVLELVSASRSSGDSGGHQAALTSHGIVPKGKNRVSSEVKRSNDKSTPISIDIMKQRMQRFENTIPVHIPKTSNNGTFVGYSLDLEKNYLRLTSEPLPHNVRPQSTLEKTLRFIMQKYSESKSYSYVINQFKSMRQDLTVQHIKNDFTICVYETNGRVSLEQNDLGEFNQCQGQLTYLYKQKRAREKNPKPSFVASELSFLIYRILYMIITNNTSEIYKLKMQVIKEYSLFERSDSEASLYASIDDLFDLHSAILSGNYYRFQSIQQSLKKFELVSQLIDKFICGKFRLRCLGTISRSYRKVRMEFVSEALGMSDAQLKDFLEKNQLAGLASNPDFDCVAARGLISGLIGSAKFNKVDIKGQI